MIFYSKDSRVLLDTEVEDNSYRHRAIMGDHNITFHYSLAEHVELPVGAYCVYGGEKFTLERPEAFKMKHKRSFEYTVTMEGDECKAKKYKFRNTVDGRLKFVLTAKPHEHLQMFVDNMNRRDEGWTIGNCVSGTEVMISYNHNYCYEALTMLANELNTEFEFVGKKVSLHKVEYEKNNPLPLSYGRGNGFRSGVGRANSGDKQPVEILFVQGGSENIDRSTYGNGELLLPKNQMISYDGEYFETDSQFNPNHARKYIVDDKGLSIRRADKVIQTGSEDSLDASSIYPKREGVVTAVVIADADKNFYDIVDNTIPASLNFNDCLIEGNKLTVIFQTGMLVTRKFEVTYYHDSVKGKKARRFELVPIEEDGMPMPSGVFVPVVGDKYAVFNCALPDSYICDNSTKTGAEWDMFKQGVKHLYESEETQFTFTGELDGIWAKKSWENIGARIKLGGYVEFSDTQFQKDGVLVRIIGVKDYINNPHSPEIELSNQTITGGFSSTLNELKGTEVVAEEYHRDSIQFTKRRFRDAKETISMLEDALLNNFTNSINPLSVQTMSMLVGDESLQFRFVDNKTAPKTVACNISYNQETKQFVCEAGIMQHLTLGISDISPQHSISEYKFWDVQRYNSAAIEDGSKKYYLYIRASRTTSAAEFTLSENAIGMNDNGDYYHFLVGVLNSEYDNERSFVTLYGYSEILPGRITTDRLVSSEGTSYFDMVNNAMKLGEVLDFNSHGDGKLRLKGTLVQSQGGTDSYLGCYRGVYNSTFTYYAGDEVTYTYNGLTSTYRYFNTTPKTGIVPTNTDYWIVVAAGSKGERGSNGTDGKDGINGVNGKSPNTAFKSTVFLRANTKPATPVGGSYAVPVPNGWSDGIPNGETKLWASTRIFSSDGQAPQQSSWTAPQQMTDTATLDIEFSSVANPSAPSGHPNTNTQWSNTSNSSTVWMATCQKTNGVWSDWQVQRIKGEKGEDGTSIKVKGTLASESQLPTTPADPSDCYIIGQNLYVWDGAKWINVGQFKGENGTNGSNGSNAYVHIKYSKSSTKNDWSDNNGETPSNYIGIYCDNLPTDQLDWDKYTWTKWKGEDGFGYEYIYKLTSSSAAPATPTATSQTDDYVPSGWFDNPPSVSQTYKYCWICYRKKTSGVWGAFIGSSANTSIAALWAKFGSNGTNGSNGADGNFTELRYAKNGSTTVAPSLSNSSLNPSGWSTSMPSCGTAEYLWLTTAVKNGKGTALVSNWSSPVRVTPYNGKDGANGTNGTNGKDGADGKSPAMLYRGDYDSSKTYYGNSVRLDCVRFSGSYYIARIDAGSFKTPAPPDTSKWNDFGASFDSVATNLLLAENANIAGWVFRNNRLESENGSMFLDGVNGKVRLSGTIQMSTSLSDKYTDANIIRLPAITVDKSYFSGTNFDDIGKICKLYNSSKLGGGTYKIYMYSFSIDERGNSASSSSYYVEIKPQECIEITCFNLGSDDETVCGVWEITNRFGYDNFLNTNYNSSIGRFPRMVALGHVYGSNTATASISGYFYDGRSLGSLFTVSRLGEGQYKVSFASGILGSGYWVLPWGYGYIRNGTNNTKASIRETASNYFIIDLSDDSSRNDGNFEFMILASNWYYNLK